MKPLLFGAILGVLWLLLGLPLTVLSTAVQPVTLAFVTGIFAAPAVRRGRWRR